MGNMLLVAGNNQLPYIKNKEKRCLGGFLHKCPFFSGHDLRVLGWSPTSGSLLSGKPASLFPLPCLSFLFLSLCLSNK